MDKRKLGIGARRRITVSGVTTPSGERVKSGIPLIRHSADIRDLVRKLHSRRATLRAIAGTVSAGFAMQMTLVVTGVVVARALGPEDRGHFAFLVLIAAIAWNFSPLGIPVALTYSIARVPARAADIVRRLTRPAVTRLIVATGVAAVLLAVLTAGRPNYVQAGALVALVTIPAVIAQQFGLSVLSGLRHFRPFNLLRLGPNALFALFATALLVSDHAGFVELVVAWGISQVVFAPLTLRTAWRHARSAQTGGGEIPSTAWMLRYGRRGFIGAGTFVDGYRVDQAVVGLFLPPIALGLYVVALAFTNLPRFVARSVASVASPTVASQQTRDEARRTMWRFFWLAVPLYAPVVAGLWLLAPQLTTFFFGEEFADAAPISRLLLIATALYCARRVLTGAASGAGYPGLGAIAEIAALASLFPLFGIFVPLLETKGVAYALICSSGIALCVLLVGLLRPGAKDASTGSSWFEIAPTGEAVDVDGSEVPPQSGAPASRPA